MMKLRTILTFLLLSNCVLKTNESDLKSYETIVNAQRRFQRYSTCLQSEQMTSRTRLHCLANCLKRNSCYTVTFIRSDKLCILYGDRLIDGQLILDSTAETIFISKRNPCRTILVYKQLKIEL